MIKQYEHKTNYLYFWCCRTCAAAPKIKPRNRKCFFHRKTCGKLIFGAVGKGMARRRTPIYFEFRFRDLSVFTNSFFFAFFFSILLLIFILFIILFFDIFYIPTMRMWCETKKHLTTATQSIIDSAGEGVVLRKPFSEYIPGRSNLLVKFKVKKEKKDKKE